MITLISFIFMLYAFFAFKYESHVPYLLCLMFILNSISSTFKITFEIISLGGIQLYPSDVVVILMVGVLIINGLKIYKTKFDLLLWLTLYFLLLSTILGTIYNGLNAEFIGEFRKFYYFFIPIIYFYNRGLKIARDKLIPIIDTLMNTILLYCCVSWFLYLVFGLSSINNTAGPLRVISSDYAIILGIYFLWCMYRDLFIDNAKTIKFRTSMFLVAIIILQHNSVWVAVGIGAFALLLLKFKEVIFNRPVVLLQIVLSLSGVFVIISLFSNITLIQNILESLNKFNDVRNESGTFGTRLEIWRGLIDSLDGYEWLFGQPFGTGYHVMYRNVYWNASPHSGYVEGLMRLGLLGISSLISSLIFLLRKSILKKEDAVVGAIIILAILVYWIAYSFTFELGVLVGCIALYVRSGKLLRKIN